MRGLVVLAIGTLMGITLAGCAAAPGQGPAQGDRQPQRHSENLVNGLITVEAGSYNTYSFGLTSAAMNPRVYGTFTASGGSGNDVKVLVMDDQAFTNWKNGHSVRTYYSSGQLTTADIDARLPDGAGKYHLVYDNTFSTFSDKDVNTRADLESYA